MEKTNATNVSGRVTMAKFEMCVQRNHYATITVEADNESDAYHLAMAKLTSGETFEWEEENGSPFGFQSIYVVNVDKTDE